MVLCYAVALAFVNLSWRRWQSLDASVLPVTSNTPTMTSAVDSPLAYQCTATGSSWQDLLGQNPPRLLQRHAGVATAGVEVDTDAASNSADSAQG